MTINPEPGQFKEVEGFLRKNLQAVQAEKRTSKAAARSRCPNTHRCATFVLLTPLVVVQGEELLWLVEQQKLQNIKVKNTRFEESENLEGLCRK